MESLTDLWAEFELEAIHCLEAIHADQTRWRGGGKGGNAQFGTLDDLRSIEASKVCCFLPGHWGYDIAAGPSRSDPTAKYWAVARPSDGRGHHFFVNQEGRVHVSAAAFTVDEESCRVPPNLEPIS